MGSKKTNKGYMYTISIVLLIVPLILLIVFYTGVTKTKMQDTTATVRCDELYYYVQDVEYDLERAMLIFGRRAAVYAIDDIVTNNKTMQNYTFHNCTDFIFDGNGSEAAIAELILCGTLYGENVTYMVNHTLPTWINRLETASTEGGYVLNLTMLDLKVLPYDAWNFATILNINIDISDSSGVCYYVGSNKSVESETDINGLEDPLYPLNTNNRVSKYFVNCRQNLSVTNLAGCSTEDWGNGSGPGNIVFYSNIKDDPGLANYCSQTEDVNEKVLVFDMSFGACQGLEYNCFDITNPDHLGGVVDYAKNNPSSSFIDKCNVTIPWISATGKMDNETQQGQGHSRDVDCADGDISTGTCVLIKNIPECDVHEVRLSFDNSNLDTHCYSISNVSQYHTSCDGEQYPDGPSFFDRLDGRLNLSEKYVGQSATYFGNPYIGIETLVDLNNLDSYGVDVNTDSTWIDYLYWANKTGCLATSFCGSSGYQMRLDCLHSHYLGVDTSCVNASGNSPESVIVLPANDTIYYDCPIVNISGVADDCDGSVLSVDLSVNGVWDSTYWDGLNWNYTINNDTTNKYALISRAKDNDGLYENSFSEKTIFIVNCTGGDNNPPDGPTLFSPIDGQTGVSRTPEFFWDTSSDSSGIYRYQIQVDEDVPDWAGLDVDDYSWDTSYQQEDTLANNRWYAWRIRAQDNAGNWGNWSAIWTFKT